MRQRYNGFAVSWWLILLGELIVLATSFFSMWLTENRYLTEYPSLAVCELFLFIPTLIGALYLKKTHSYASVSSLMGLRSFDPIMMLLLLLLPSATQYFSGFMQLPFIETLVKVFGEQTDIAVPETISELMWLFLILCIAAPLFEELIFRGVIIKILEPYGTFAAVFTTALGFALLHFSPTVFFSVFALGAVLGIVRVYSGSVFACMLFHSIFNFTSLMQLVFQDNLEAFEMPLTIYAVVMSCLFPLLLFIMYRLYGRGKWFRGTIGRCKGGALPIVITVSIFVLMSISLALTTNPPKTEHRIPESIPQTIPPEESLPDTFSDDFFDSFFDDDFTFGEQPEGGETAQ